MTKLTKAQRLDQYAEECARHFMASGVAYTCHAAVLDVIKPWAIFYAQDDNISYRTVINRAIAKIDARSQPIHYAAPDNPHTS